MTGDDDDPSKKNGCGLNSNSPLYIQASDYPKQIRANDTLTDNKYIDWSQEMINFLFAKDKVGFIDGSIPKHENTSEDYNTWMRCDAMVKGWLTTVMEKDIIISVKYANTASKIWSGLLERFGKESAPRASALMQTLTVTHQNGTFV